MDLGLRTVALGNATSYEKHGECHGTTKHQRKVQQCRQKLVLGILRGEERKKKLPATSWKGCLLQSGRLLAE